MNTLTYRFENGEIRLTGARFSGMVSTLIREGFAGSYASLSASDISMLHAFFEADANGPEEVAFFMRYLPHNLRDRAVELGIIL